MNKKTNQDILLHRCIKTKQWHKSLDNEVLEVLESLKNDQKWQDMVFVLTNAPFEKGESFYKDLPPKTWHDYGYLLIKDILKKSSEKNALDIIYGVFKKDDKQYRLKQGQFINELLRNACKKDDIKVLEFCKQSGFSLKGTFVFKVINNSLENKSPQALDWAYKQSPSLKSMRIEERMARCVNMKNAEGVSLVCQFVKKHDPYFFQNFDQKVWECLKENNFHEVLPKGFKGIEALGVSFKHIHFSDGKNQCLTMLRDITSFWDEKNIDWKTPFVGAVSENPESLEIFLLYNPKYTTDAVFILGKYYIEKHKEKVPSLYAQHIKNFISDGIKNTNNKTFKVKKI